ncbi:trypsin alpha-like [Eurosta solidaginis]|uniref:trypsin alpha-like n=1 Tax=Eurosta solidaginis TaxID=178769 RepID=UPI00353100E9
MNLRDYFTIFFAVLSSLFSYAKSRFRIVCGELLRIEDSPYMVSIYHIKTHICAGSLVTMEKVITAAHCVADKEAKILVVKAGVTNRVSETGQCRTGMEVFISYAYEAKTYHMDIAGIKLSTPFIKSPQVSTIPICSTQLTPNTPMEVSGWGSTSESSKDTVAELRTTVVHIIAKTLCANNYHTKGTTVTKIMICAGLNGKDTCHGDSGTPGVVGGELCAVVSCGVGCGRPEFPGIYTDMTNKNVQWFIDKFMNC